ncbi:MAG: hypothetical protein ACTSUM_00670 [Alphaproteobacteria bacterium]|nr:MAG: hypothetical protein B6I23_00130 [Rickettsiaceae bacterium 4572_127]
MNKIILAKKDNSVYALKEFPIEGAETIQAFKLSEKPKYYIDMSFEKIINELPETSIEVAVSGLKSIITPKHVFGSGKSYFANGEKEADFPPVWFSRETNKMLISPYNQKIKLPKATSKLTAEAELGIVYDKKLNILGYVYCGDPTTREMHGKKEKSGYKTCGYPVSFLIKTADNLPPQDEIKVVFSGKYVSAEFSCQLCFTGKKKGLYLTESKLLGYLDKKNNAKEGLLMAGNPDAKALKSVDKDDIVKCLEDGGLEQKILVGNQIVWSCTFEKKKPLFRF